MSRGIGKTQQRILDELETAADHAALTAGGLAERIGISDRQVRRAVHALAGRGLVVLTKENGGWQGQGEYGRVVPRKRMVDDPDGDKTRYEGSYWGIPQEGDEAWPMSRADGTRKIKGTPVRYRIEWDFIPNGMPTGATLFVWLPEKRVAWLESRAKMGRQIRAAFGVG